MAAALDLQLSRAAALAAAARIRLTEPFMRALRRLLAAAGNDGGRPVTDRDLRRLIAGLTFIAHSAPQPLAPRIRVERAAAQAGGVWPAAVLRMRDGERRAVPAAQRPAKASPKAAGKAAPAKKRTAVKTAKPPKKK